MRGVSWNKAERKWIAKLAGYGACGYIGIFADHAGACEARRAAEIAIDGYEHDQSVAVIGEDGFGRIPVFERRGRLFGWALVDGADLPRLAPYRWNRNCHGYAVRFDAGRWVFLHRLVCPDGSLGDHRDGDKMNNRRSNLRGADWLGNARNSAKSWRNTGYKGVRAQGRRFAARITVNYREVHLGRFASPDEAARAYDRAAVEHFGRFARLNFPDDSQVVSLKAFKRYGVPGLSVTVAEVLP